MKVRTLFSGIGAPESALTKLGVDFEIIDFCEIDKYAVKSYCAIHEVDESKNLGDISKVWGRDLPYADLLVWGFPCQDISVAGKQRGIQEGETRSGLYYEGFRILKETRPKYSIIENVKNLVGKKFKADFESMLDDIESLGYNNYWKVLNAKNYGIPQNRERVFIVSIRKDVDTGDFTFPEGFDNGLRLKDFLEDEVDEKFYISNGKTEKLIKQLDFKNKDLQGIDLTINQPKFKDYANCIKARYDAGVSNQRTDGTGVCEPMLFGGEQKNQAIKTDGISTCLTSSMGTGGGYVPMVTEACIPCITPDRVEKKQNGRRFKEDGDPMFTLTGQDRLGDSINIQFPNSDTRRGRVGKECAQTLETSCNQAVIDPYNRTLPKDQEAITTLRTNYSNGNAQIMQNYRIRKLTPKECWRLMGFTDEEFAKAEEVNSNSQLYKQAGNSIVVDVLEYIFKNLLK
jgi:DNA (cytosine-5)-methyltransferase 1